jgi:hypothetical protein
VVFLCVTACEPPLANEENVTPMPVIAPAAVPAPDAGSIVDAGTPDAGASDAGLADAGTPPCDDGLVANAGFECGLDGWLVLKGAARLANGSAWSGVASLELTADSGGEAVVARLAPLSVSSGTTLCFAFHAQGTVPAVRLEILTAPANQGASFAAPVTKEWTHVPPSMMKVDVPGNSQVWMVIRAMGAVAGQSLQLDAFEVSQNCSP